MSLTGMTLGAALGLWSRTARLTITGFYDIANYGQVVRQAGGLLGIGFHNDIKSSGAESLL